MLTEHRQSNELWNCGFRDRSARTYRGSLRLVVTEVVAGFVTESVTATSVEAATQIGIT
jgi:hypothetical protein